MIPENKELFEKGLKLMYDRRSALSMCKESDMSIKAWDAIIHLVEAHLDKSEEKQADITVEEIIKTMCETCDKGHDTTCLRYKRCKFNAKAIVELIKSKKES